MRILIASDAWSPQVNGVVTTLRNTVRELERLGHLVKLITPDGFRTVPCPTYPEIRLADRARAARRASDRRSSSRTPCTSTPKDLWGSPRADIAWPKAGRSRPRTTHSFPSSSMRVAGCRSPLPIV